MSSIPTTPPAGARREMVLGNSDAMATETADTMMMGLVSSSVDNGCASMHSAKARRREADRDFASMGLALVLNGGDASDAAAAATPSGPWMDGSGSAGQRLKSKAKYSTTITLSAASAAATTSGGVFSASDTALRCVSRTVMRRSSLHQGDFA